MREIILCMLGLAVSFLLVMWFLMMAIAFIFEVSKQENYSFKDVFVIALTFFGSLWWFWFFILFLENLNWVA